MDHPQFWSKFFFILPYRQTALPTLDAWLQRSANTPIDINVIDLAETVVGTPQKERLRLYRTKLLSMLLRHLPRWKKLDVESTGTLFRVLQDIDFLLCQSLNEVRLCFEDCTPDIHRGVLHALERAPHLHSLNFAPNVSSHSSILLDNPSFGFLKQLKRLSVTENLTASKALEIMRRCPSAEWICARAVRVNREPIAMVSSETLRILDLTFGSEDREALAYLHLPNLRVFFVLCIHKGGYEMMRAISRFIAGDSGRSLQVLRVANPNIESVADLVREQAIRNIPIMEVYVKIPLYEDYQFERIVFGCFEQWKKIDSMFKKELRPDTRLRDIG